MYAKLPNEFLLVIYHNEEARVREYSRFTRLASCALRWVSVFWPRVKCHETPTSRGESELATVINYILVLPRVSSRLMRQARESVELA